MEQNIDVLIQRLRTELFSLINNAGRTIPPSMIYYVVKDVYQEVDATYMTYLKDLQQKLAAAAEEEAKTQEDVDAPEEENIIEEENDIIKED